MDFIPFDLITGALSFTFTVLIFSYVIGDNPLFRVGTHVFVGVTAGYIAAIAWWQILWARLIYPLIFEPLTMLEKGLLLAPALGVILILMKIFPSLAGLARFAMAFLVGVGAAATIAGAMTGTLVPQFMGTINAFDPNVALARNIGFIQMAINGGIILAGVIFTLAYFHFGARPDKTDGAMRRMKLIEIMAWVGRLFIGITLGAMFAGAYAAALTALIERIDSLINFVGSFL